MKKIIFIFALAILLNSNANATDRDCAQYSTSQALSATSDDSTNTVGIIFSGMTARKGTTNADCATSSAGGESESDTTGSGTAQTVDSGTSNDSDTSVSSNSGGIESSSGQHSGGSIN